jgi:hypothetical protein
LFLAVRLHWKLGTAIALAAIAALAGIASASGLLGLEQTRRVAVACVHASLTPRRAVIPAEPYLGAGDSATSRPPGAAAHHRPRSCESDQLTPSRGLARHRAVRRAATVPLPPSGEATGVADGVVASPGGSRDINPRPDEPLPPALDSTPPQTSISSGPPAITTATTVSFAFSSNEAGSTFQCKLDSGAWGACISPKGYSSIAVGSHKFSVRATDPAGNVDQSPATQSWTVEGGSSSDTTPPQTSIIAGPPPVTTSTSASFTLTSSESGSSFECQLDNGTWTPCEARETYSELDLGEHQFAARAIDPAANVDASPATRAWEVEEVPSAPPPPPAECSSTVASTQAAESAVSAAAPGSVICLADGSYGEVSISAVKSAQVTLQAEHPGKATITGASMDGSHLTLARFNISNEITIEPGSASMAVEYNRITGGYMGINAGPTTSTSISDTTIRGNKLVGPFGEDALRINRYHDSGDADPYGILIEGNEITGVRENGNHSDCLQSVWGGDGLYFRRNYLHDNRCQGFFVKDQPSTVVGISVEDNLFLRDSEPCAPEAPGCGQPSYLQVFGPYQDFTMRRNTIWQGEVVATFQEGAGTGTAIESNVVNRFWTSTNLSGIVYSENTVCKRETASGGSWPAQIRGETVDCAPSFNNPTSDDFRLIGSTRGVDWAPAEQHFGP